MPSKIEIKTVIPMNHAEKCPVCSGFGTVSKKQKVCHSCDGSGWVIVPNFTDEHLAMYSNTFGNMVIEKDEYEE